VGSVRAIIQPMYGKLRRKVDWAVIADGPVRARLVSPSSQAFGLAQITSALLSDPSAQTVDRVLRESIEFARTTILLERASIFLVGPGGHSMIGTWGTSADGQTTDEHDLMFDVDEMVSEFFARLAQGHAWSLYEDCPLITHEDGRSRTLGRGWLACTPIQGSGQPIGVLFNDTALTHAPIDEGKQARAVVLCSLLGRALDACRDCLFESPTVQCKPRHPLVRHAAELLVADPSLSFQKLAERLHVSKGHLTRAFKRHADVSIVDYRNELRLAQFLSQVSSKALLDAALDAGFGSYAQFHRVFRARFGKPPREYLFEHQVEQEQTSNRSLRLGDNQH
jgi:AraC-like DNA-binding protein